MPSMPQYAQYAQYAHTLFNNKICGRVDDRSPCRLSDAIAGESGQELLSSCHPVILSLGAGAAGYPVRYFSRKLAETVGRIRSLLYD